MKSPAIALLPCLQGLKYHSAKDVVSMKPNDDRNWTGSDDIVVGCEKKYWSANVFFVVHFSWMHRFLDRVRSSVNLIIFLHLLWYSLIIVFILCYRILNLLCFVCYKSWLKYNPYPPHISINVLKLIFLLAKRLFHKLDLRFALSGWVVHLGIIQTKRFLLSVY